MIDGPTRPVCGIVYSSRRAVCDTIAARLNSDGIVAAAYHAGLNANDRERILNAWVDGEKIGVVVATVAFGMGVDRGDVHRATELSDFRYVLSFTANYRSRLKVRFNEKELIQRIIKNQGELDEIVVLHDVFCFILVKMLRERDILLRRTKQEEMQRESEQVNVQQELVI